MPQFTSKEIERIVIIIILLILLIITIYNVGYYKRANDINVRIINTPNNQEECFTREEIDFFIYGE